MTMMITTETSVVLPSARPNDSDDVRWALETAAAMWSRGDTREALRWLRRAAESAAEEGLDMRAVELAKGAAELRAHADIAATTPPPAPSAPPESARRLVAAAVQEPRRSLELVADEEPDDSPAAEIDPPPDEPSPVAGWTDDDAGWDDPATGDAPSGAAPPPNEAVFEAALESIRAFDQDDESALEAAPSRRFMKTDPGIVPPSMVPPASALPANAVPQNDASNGQGEEHVPNEARFASHQALRVAVGALGERPGWISARVLRPGEAVPPGMREALFVSLDGGPPLPRA